MRIRVRYSDSLMHYGKKGMHWGERRYQNEDGSYTALGRIHYGIGQGRKVASKVASSAVNKVRAAAPGVKSAAGNVGRTVVKVGAAAALAKGITAGASDQRISERTNRNNLLANYNRSNILNKTIKKQGKAEAYRARKAKSRAKMEYKQAKWQYKKAKSDRGIRGALKKAGGFAAGAVGTALINKLISGTSKDTFESAKREIGMKAYYEQGKMTPKQKKAYEKTLKKQGYTESEISSMWNSKEATGKGPSKANSVLEKSSVVKEIQNSLSMEAPSYYTPSDSESIGSIGGSAAWDSMTASISSDYSGFNEKED